MFYFVIGVLASVFCIGIFIIIVSRFVRCEPPAVLNHDFFHHTYYYYVPHNREEIIQLLSASSDADQMDYRLTHKPEPELWILERVWVTGACAYEYTLIFEETADGCHLTLQHLSTHFQLGASSCDPYYDEINTLMAQKIHAEPIPVPK